MTSIPSVTLSNTFDFQRQRLNDTITFVNTESANLGFLTSSYVTNTSFQTSVSTLNTSIGDRLQVANASLQFDNRYLVANARSDLANTNLRFSNYLEVSNSSTFSTTGKAIAMAIVFG